MGESVFSVCVCVCLSTNRLERRENEKTDTDGTINVWDLRQREVANECTSNVRRDVHRSSTCMHYFGACEGKIHLARDGIDRAQDKRRMISAPWLLNTRIYTQRPETMYRK